MLKSLFRRGLSLLLSAAAVLTLGGCNGGKNGAHELSFPSGGDEVTEYNQDILNTPIFTVSVELPQGWTIRQEGEREHNALFSVRYLFDGDGVCIGTVGYNVIAPLSEEEMQIPAAIYNQIALANHYQFDVRSRYEIVTAGEQVETALTDVYYSDVMTDGDGERINKGILMCDREKGVYLAFEFDAEALTGEEWKAIAESIALKD